MDSLTELRVERADPRDPRVGTLIARHLDLMRSVSPPESVFAQEAEGLERDGARLFAVVGSEGEMLGIGAYKMIAEGHAELKSMHVASEARGRGAGRALLDAILSSAISEGAERASLETGSAPAFAPALALYRGAGFALCDAFDPYVENPFSLFLTRQL